MDAYIYTPDFVVSIAKKARGAVTYHERRTLKDDYTTGQGRGKLSAYCEVFRVLELEAECLIMDNAICYFNNGVFSDAIAEIELLIPSNDC